MSGSFVHRRGRAALLASASGAAIGLVMGLGTMGAHAQTFYPQNGNVPDNTANTVTVTNETNGAICDLLGGDDSVTVNNSTVTGATNCMTVPGSPTATTTGTVTPFISLGDGNDIFTLFDPSAGVPASVVNAAISGGAGNDTILLDSGTVNGDVQGGTGDDRIQVNGATVNGNLQGEAGNDRYDILSGLVNGDITDSFGNDIYNLAGGRITGSIVDLSGANQVDTGAGFQLDGSITLGAGVDTLNLAGGTIAGNVNAGTGPNTITISGAAIGGDLTAGAPRNGSFTTFVMSGGSIGGSANVGSADALISGGTIVGDLISDEVGEFDVFRITGGSVRGVLGFDSLVLNGGTIGGDITGIDDIAIEQTAPGVPLLLAAGITLSSTSNAAGTITNTNLANALNFAGFGNLTLSNSQLTLATGAQDIDNLIANAGSTLNVSGNTSLGPVGAMGSQLGNLTLNGSTVSLINGSTDDVLNVDRLTIDSATIGVDADLSRRVADQVLVRSSNVTGVNTLLVNSVTPGVLLDPGAVIAISPVAGEMAPSADAAPVQNVLVRGVGTAAFNDFNVVLGSLGGVYLASPGMNTNLVGEAGGLPRVAVDSRPPEMVTRDVTRLTGDAVDSFNGLSSEARAGAAISPTFGVFATGQAGRVFHDGFEITSTTPPGEGPEFRSDEFSVIGSVEYDLGKALELESTRVTLGGFAGYTSADVMLGESPALVGLGFGAVGNAENASGIFGAYGLVGRGLYYGVGALTGFVGDTEIDNSVLGTDGLYQTTGYAVTGSAGRIFALTERIRADLRVGGVYTKFFGDDFTDSAGNRFGSSEISFGSIRFEPGVFTSLQVGDYAVSPYLRGQISQRIGYNNEANIQGQDFSFDDADLSFGLQLGTNVTLTEKLTLKAELAGRTSEDSNQFTGKLGLKFKF